MSSLLPDTLPLPGLPQPIRTVSRAVATNSRLALTDHAIRRFWAHVVRAEGEGCWIWCGAISKPDGYGRFTWQTGGERRTVSAHRIALMIHQAAELPEGIIGEHGCCEPLCVRVDDNHLWPGTQSENINHAVALGRHRGNLPVMGSQHRWERSVLVRDAVRQGWDEHAYHRACQKLGWDEGQLALW
ncbi:hypothetical protein [Corynebacterium hylobatis]|uniref:hypothetical protein n=1 Tax=Corynebacterium hylobatis TaxID=1859290 RepID=UPI001F49EAC1|nr:hypothetical protein [Corynebacterium hylobatis]